MSQSYKNTVTGQFTTDMTWQEVPISKVSDGKFLLFIEGQEVYVYIGEGSPTLVKSFKIPDNAALEWDNTVESVWVQGTDLLTVVYYLS